MLTGFEDITQDLTPEEKAQCRTVWRVMNEAFVSGNSITNTQIRTQLKDKYNMKSNGPKIRKMISWMHTNGHLTGLIASSGGYSRAQDIHDLLKYRQSLKERIGAQISRYKAVEADINKFK